MTRILCIHGMGTNGSIFRIQTTALRGLLPSHWEYEFFDAEFECGPAPGIDPSIYPGPYFCPHRGLSVARTNEALDLLLDYMDLEGPFDGVWAFSAGGTALLSLLLRHQMLKPHSSPLFRHALFICSELPYSASEACGIDVTPLITHKRHIPVDLLAIQKALEEVKEEGRLDPTTVTAKAFAPAAMSNTIAEAQEDDTLDENVVIRRWTPEHDRERLSGIACGFVVGKQDELRNYGIASASLIDQKFMCGIVEHTGGHEIPRDKPQQQRIADLASKIVMRSELL